MRSDTVKKGIQQAPHRSLFNALGLTEEELDRPLIGVVSSYNEIVPGHMNLDRSQKPLNLAWQWPEEHQSWFLQLLSVMVLLWDISV